MEKRISFDVFQSVKRVAQACNPIMIKRNKVQKKIEALVKEYQEYDTQISALEAGIKQVVGFRVEQLVKKVIEPGTDYNGSPKKTTKYLPTDIVKYDNATKQYVISVPEETNVAAEPVEAPVTENGNDYDADVEASTETEETVF